MMLDMDGVLADFERHAYDGARELGCTFDIAGLHEQTSKYCTDHIPNRRERKVARTMIESPGFFETLPVMPGAIEGARELIAAGIDVWVCTKPLETNPTCRDAKGAWLRRYLPELEHKLIIAPDKSIIVGDILLDDAPNPSWFPIAPWRPVVFAAPYNGAGSAWEHVPSWTWGEPVCDLVAAASALRYISPLASHRWQG